MGSPCTMPSSAWEEASGLQAWQAWGIGPHAGLCSILRSNRLSASLTEPIVSRRANATRLQKRSPYGTTSTLATMQECGKSICNEVDEMSMVDRHNSALHDSDNGYYIDSGCCQEDNFKSRCGCGDSEPDYHCNLCRKTGLTLARRWWRPLTLHQRAGMMVAEVGPAMR